MLEGGNFYYDGNVVLFHYYNNGIIVSTNFDTHRVNILTIQFSLGAIHVFSTSAYLIRDTYLACSLTTLSIGRLRGTAGEEELEGPSFE